MKFAKTCDDKSLELVETHYKTKEIPSETAKVIAKRVLDETGKTVKIKSFLKYNALINDWRVGDLHCRVRGFGQLGKDVLNIAYFMKDAPRGLYDLDKLVSILTAHPRKSPSREFFLDKLPRNL